VFNNPNIIEVSVEKELLSLLSYLINSSTPPTKFVVGGKSSWVSY